MDELFNFSFPEFGLDSFFESAGENLPNIAEQIAKFALTQAVGGGSSKSSPQQLANIFARQLFAQRNAPELSSYFTLSQGQSMAQLASLIFRAQRRFL